MSAYAALNPKHKRFVDEYVVDLNGAQAAIRAGYSEGRAKQTANDLLGREDVKGAVAEKQGDLSADASDRATKAIARLEEIAFIDVGPLAEAAPALLNVSRAACVDLLKLEGKLPDRVWHTGKNGGPIEHKAVHDLSDEELSAIASAGRGGTPAPPAGPTEPDRLRQRDRHPGKAGV